MLAFGGAKIALLCADLLVTYKRDDKIGIPFSGLWDLPGGGREGDETPSQCALREFEEEFSICIPHGRICWQRCYSGTPDTYFLVTNILPGEVSAIRFGDEGERWKMMSFHQFLQRRDAVPHLQKRFREYLEEKT